MNPYVVENPDAIEPMGDDAYTLYIDILRTTLVLALFSKETDTTLAYLASHSNRYDLIKGIVETMDE